MPKEFSRKDRVAELLQRELAWLIQQEIKDPRLGMITVSAVEVSKDLAHAKVYVTVLGDDEMKIKQSIQILNDAAAYLRTQLWHKLKMRSVPELRFLFDESIRYGNRLSALIDKAVGKK